MVTLADLKVKIDRYNELTKQDITLFHYWRAKFPYALRLNNVDIIRGSKDDLFTYLLGLNQGINDFAAYRNIRIEG
jgi:hypothetical protein